MRLNSSHNVLKEINGKIETRFLSVMQLDFIRRLRQMIEKEGYTVTGKKYRGRERDHKQFEIEGRV